MVAMATEHASADQPPEVTEWLRQPLQRRWKVEFWTMAPRERHDGVPVQGWQLFDAAYYFEFAKIWTHPPVSEWRMLAGLWVRTRLVIEEEELCERRFRESGRVEYWPANPM